jgi:GT2 family glycosyltransferase
MVKQPLVSVVIPTYNRRQKLKRLLISVLKSDYRNIEILVVDDASADGTLDEVKDLDPNVRLVRNESERLLAGCRNVGILNTHGDLIFLIDDDNVIAKDAVHELVEFMCRDMTVGVAGPIMYYLTDPSRVWCSRVKRNYITSQTVFPERNRRHVRFDQILESDDFPNAFMIRRSVVDKMGLFDETNFPIHYDEADFCNRVKQAGFRVVSVPSARVWHDIPLPTGKIDGARRFSVHTGERAFYAARNRILFFRKYSKRHEFVMFLTLFMPAASAVYLKTILTDPKLVLRQRLTCAQGYIKGTVCGLSIKIKTKRYQHR